VPAVVRIVLSVALLLAAARASGQDGTTLYTPRDAGATLQPAEGARDVPEPHRSGFSQFVRDVAGDYGYVFSKETALWWGGGAASAGLVHLADEALRQETEDPEAGLTRTLEAGGTGATYGNLSLQVPLAIGWWALGHAANSPGSAAAGRSLLRAQINALSWTYAFKFAVNRTRPNGDPRSFPSGHASATFATAAVLQHYYGWRVGLPVYAAASLTGASRITVDKHWASDVVFGAFIGIASGRTATRLERRTGFAIQPLLRGDRVGVTVTRIDRRP